jgi:hypothetical protein
MYFTVCTQLMMAVNDGKMQEKKHVNKLTDFIDNLSLSVIFWKRRIVLMDGQIYVVILSLVHSRLL